MIYNKTSLLVSKGSLRDFKIFFKNEMSEAMYYIHTTMHLQFQRYIRQTKEELIRFTYKRSHSVKFLWCQIHKKIVTLK